MDALIIASANDNMLMDFALSEMTKRTFLNYPIPFFDIDGRIISNFAMLKHCLDGESKYDIEQKNMLLKKKYEPKFLNGIYLATILEEHGMDVECINHFDNEFDQFLTCLNKNPKTIVISTTFICGKYSFQRIVDIIRQYAPDVFIVAGGPFVAYSYNISKQIRSDSNKNLFGDTYIFMDNSKELDVDIYITDKFGINTLVQLIRRIKEGKDYEDIQNLAFYKDKYIFTKNNPEKHLVNDFIVPWDRVDEKFLGHTIPLQGSIGCPFKCNFCNFHNFSGSLEIKKIELIEKELQLINKRKNIIKEVAFTDENFLLSRKSLESFCRMKIKNKIDLPWSSFVRGDVITKENGKLLSDSGAYSMSMGAESGNNRILKLMNKKIVPETYLESIKILNENFISTVSSFIIGFPGETNETLQDTVRFIDDFPDYSDSINWISVFPFILLPMSFIESHRAPYALEGALLDWEHTTMNSIQAIEKMQAFILSINKPYLASIEMNKSIEELGMGNKNAKYLLGLMWEIIKSDFDAKILGKNKKENKKVILKSIKQYLAACLTKATLG